MPKTITCVSFALLLGLVMQQGQAAESDIVDGFTEFLIERANANLIEVFRRQLESDKKFQCYFPNTYAKIEKLELADLFASKSYWEDGLIKDLRTLKGRARFWGIHTVEKLVYQENFIADLRKGFIESSQKFEYEFEGDSYPINSIPLNPPEELKNQINGFSNSLAEALNRLDARRDTVESRKDYKDFCDFALNNKTDYEQQLEVYEQVSKDLSRWVYHVEKYGKNLRLPEAEQRQFYCEFNDIEASDCASVDIAEPPSTLQVLSNDKTGELREIIRLGEQIGETMSFAETPNRPRPKALDTIDQAVLLLPSLENDKFTDKEVKEVQKDLEKSKELSEQQMKQELASILGNIKQELEIALDDVVADADFERIAGLLRGLVYDERSYTDQALSALELLEEVGDLEDHEMDRLRRNVIFFVSIADAENKDTVKAILEAYTLPAVSYTEKRKQGYGFFISSYLGAALADSDVHDSQEEASDGGLFVPVGLEYNYGRSDGASVSIMLSPIDMAYPVNLKLRGIEDDVEFDELIAPSLALSYGFEDWPVNIGVAYQRGRRLDDVDESEEKWLLFFTFDMPLLRLY